MALRLLALSLPLAAATTLHAQMDAHTQHVAPPGRTVDARAASEAIANENRLSAGRLSKGVFTLKLEARTATWYPEANPGPAVPTFAFAEAGQAPRIPGPMIRVPAGTEMHVSVTNTLSRPIRFRGLQDHSSAELDTVVIAPGASQTFDFRADVPGSYYYFARTEAFPPILEPGVRQDAMLVGAFIVDPVGVKPPRNERVLVISAWSDSLAALGVKSKDADQVLRRELIPAANWFVATINGKAWPYTERLAYNVGDTIRWRVINGGALPHPMHLHGFYFDIDARGDAERDTVYTTERRHKAVTEWMLPGSTMAMTWIPTRAGNWIFHCHLVTHISETLRIARANGAEKAHAGHNHAEESMAGLVMGIKVYPAKNEVAAREPVARRKLRLFVTQKENVYGDRPGFSYVLQEGNTPPAADSVRFPSSTLLLRKDEPTEITVINRAKQMASIHWHGVELESFYDGVGDWSGWGSRLAPVLSPGDSFVVRLTPQRAGTFIYHSHSNEAQQIPSGLYGTLIVLPETGVRDTSERVFLIGIGGPGEDARTVINGSSSPPPVELTAGTAHRFRLVNISPLETHSVQLLARDTIQQWRALAKDGADLPASQASSRRATLLLHPGETYDFEVLRPRADSLTLRVNSPETIRVRLEQRARGVPREALKRANTDIPVIVR